MNIQNELSLLFNSLFSDELLQTLLQIYQHDMIQQGCKIYERDYQAGIKSLSTILSDEQTKILQAIEQKYEQKMRQFFILSFQKSTCSYFQACFPICFLPWRLLCILSFFANYNKYRRDQSHGGLCCKSKTAFRNCIEII